MVPIEIMLELHENGGVLSLDMLPNGTSLLGYASLRIGLSELYFLINDVS